MRARAASSLSGLLIGLLIGLSIGLAGAQSAPAATPVEPDVDAAHRLAGREPAAARAQLGLIRQAAMAGGRLAQRLAADEAECRILGDISASQALQVAEAGAAAAASAAARDDPRARVQAMRLAVCGAGARLDLGETAAGGAALDALIDQAAREPGLAEAGEMAWLERGLHRSRRGELLAAQEDLLRACEALRQRGREIDVELCHSHLATLYKRIGDTDEALRLLAPLLEAAQARGAVVDVGVYRHGLAQIRAARDEWAQALDEFEGSRAAAEATRDEIGIAYAEHGLAVSLLRLGRSAEAMPHVQRALGLLRADADPTQLLNTRVVKAQVHVALRQPQEALAELAAVAEPVQAVGDRLLLAEWHRGHAQAQALAGGWRQAYDSLETAMRFQLDQHRQRLSEQGARLRMQFNREKDAAELGALHRLDDQRTQLVRTQAVALVLFVVLLAAAVGFAAHKRREARRLALLALADELTGLPNRRAVLERLELELERSREQGRPLSVMMVDADRFKAVNDSLGHAVGDQVLRHLAGVLGGTLRTDDSLGRLGGEEFLAVLPDAPLADTRAIAERMREAVAETVCQTTAGPLALSVSIGVAAHRGDAESASQILQRADQALYAAKTQGRNRVCAAEGPEAAPA